MPIEIKELHIKTIITEGGRGNNGAGGGKISPKDRELIIAQCLEKVLEVIKERKER